MKMKSILAVLFLVVVAVVAGATTPPDQPYMEAARADLQNAKAELQAALRNKGGHRYNAAVLVNQAIGEVNAGIAYARRHNHASSPDQPHMQAALTSLNNALNNLKQAEADKGGHRAKAIDIVNQAISEVNLGIQAGEGG
jgi:hypothetical protein